MASHILSQITVFFFAILLIFNVEPRQNRILRNIVIISTGYLVKPLQVLIVGHFFIDPLERFMRIQVVLVGIFLHLHILLHDVYEGIGIVEIEIEHDFLALTCFNIDCVG